MSLDFCQSPGSGLIPQLCQWLHDPGLFLLWHKEASSSRSITSQRSSLTILQFCIFWFILREFYFSPGRTGWWCARAEKKGRAGRKSQLLSSLHLPCWKGNEGPAEYRPTKVPLLCPWACSGKETPRTEDILQSVVKKSAFTFSPNHVDY